MNRENWQHDGWGFHFPDGLPPDHLRHLDWIERMLGPKVLRAVPALIARGISPWRTDQFEEIKQISPRFGVGYERLAACFGYLNERHLFETMLEPELRPLVYPTHAAGLCVFRLMTGVPLPELRVSKSACALRASGVLDI